MQYGPVVQIFSFEKGAEEVNFISTLTNFLCYPIEIVLCGTFSTVCKQF